MRKKETPQTPYFDRRTVLVTLFIGLAYLWTSSAYLNWTNHLAPLASSGVTYLATEAGGAAAQVIGLLLCILFLRHSAAGAVHGRLIICVMVLDGCACLPVLFSGDGVMVLAWGLVMNVFHGAIAGYYIARLSCHVPKDRRAICFGGSYAAGNVGGYLLSLIGGGGFQQTGYVWFVYAALIAAGIALHTVLERGGDKTDLPVRGERLSIPPACLLAGAVIILLELTTQLLLVFPAQAYIADPVILNFSHLFYSVGLIIAAAANDRKRGAGLILAVLSLCFPLLSLSLYPLAHMLPVLAVAGYVVTGFFSVYRVMVFADLYDGGSHLLMLAPAGLLCGRVGEATGAVLAPAISDDHVLLTTMTAVLFVVTIVLAFLLYVRLYGARPATTAEERRARFYAAHELSAREQQVFALLIDGKSNQEIADALFISENTAKFHVRNLLKKTGCQKRSDIVRKFQTYT